MSQATLSSNPSTVRAPRRRWELYWAIGICAALVSAVALVYGQTLWHGFAIFDDGLFVTNQPRVMDGLTWRGLIWAFTTGPEGDWCPLAMLSHMLDCQLFGLRPAGHHFTNVLLHAASTVALFLVLWRMTDRLWPSSMVAALFGLHPLHVESVAWIAERRDVLSGLFFMLTLGAYTHYTRRPNSVGRYLTVVVFFVLGLLAKSMLVTLPPLLLLLDFWPLGRLQPRSDEAADAQNARPTLAWRLIWEKLPLLALSLAMIAVTLLSHRVEAPNPVLTLPERLANAAVSCVAYLGQLLVPVGMSIFYSYPETGPPGWQVAGATAILVCLTVGAVALRRTQPYLFVGWFWYVGMLLPVLEVIPVGAHARADRYTYLSQIGLYIALVWGALRLTAAWPALGRLLPVGAALALVVLAAGTWRQVGYWRDDATLWSHALDCDPDNVTAHYHLALDFREKDVTRSTEECLAAVKLAPGHRNLYYSMRARAYLLLADIAIYRDDPSAAIAHCEQALAMYPDFGHALTMLGRLLVNQGEFSPAIERMRRCTDLEPNNPASWCNLAWAETQAGQTNEAIKDYRRAIQIGRDDAIAHRSLANLLADMGNVDAAINLLRRAIQIDPRTPSTYFQLAALLRSQGKLGEAVDFDERGDQAGRRLAKTCNQRGSELLEQGDLAGAIAQFRSAIEANGDDAQARCNLADALAQQGKATEAADQYRQALQITPDFAPARRGLEKLESR